MKIRACSSTWILVAFALGLATIGCAAVTGLGGGGGGKGEGGGGGFNMISLDDEWKMRGELMQQVQKEFKLLNDSRAVAFVDQVGQRIVSKTDLADREWDFGVIDDPAVNAFNLPGGLVYVNRGLLVQADALDQVAAVMAHEIGHGVARHGTQMMTRAYGLDIITSIVLGKDQSQAEKIVGGLVGGGVLSKYSREAEREADELGIRFMHAAGYDPRGAAAMFRKLLTLREREPSKLERFFSSHPLSEERIAAAEQQAEALARSANLIHDTREFQDLRRRLGGS